MSNIQVMGRANSAGVCPANHLGCMKPVNSGVNQLELVHDFLHQQ